jgi:hypothetical protein
MLAASTVSFSTVPAARSRPDPGARTRGRGDHADCEGRDRGQQRVIMPPRHARPGGPLLLFPSVASNVFVEIADVSLLSHVLAGMVCRSGRRVTGPNGHQRSGLDPPLP